MNYNDLVQGVDASHWNGAVSWTALANDGVAFAYIKASQGMNEDPMFSTNATAAQNAGIVTLAYPFVTPSDTPACVEKFKSIVGPTMPAVLDCEVAGLEVPIPLWIAGLDARPTLAYVGIYPPFTPPRTIWTMPRILPEYAPRPRISAWDGVSTPDWSKEWVIWQRSSQTQFKGATGNFDLDVLAVPLPRFKTWCETGSWDVAGTPQSA